MRGLLTSIVVAGVLVTPAATSSAHFTSGCKKSKCKRHVVKPYDDKLDRMAQCESTGRWFIDALHDGGLQFHPGTWSATGSKFRFAFQAPILEQKYRAVIWYFKIGRTFVTTAGWPKCGYA